MSTISKLVYAIAFQVGWFVCIMAGNIASFAYAVIFLIAHLWFVTKPRHSLFLYKEILNKEITWVLLIVIFGVAIETISFSGGFLHFQTAGNLQLPKNIFEQFLFPPLWLISLWLIFALALRTCLSFVFHKPGITYLLSIIFVPVNYYAGAELNTTVALNQPYFLSLALITLLWLVFLWCIIQIKHHYFEDMFNVNKLDT